MHLSTWFFVLVTAVLLALFNVAHFERTGAGPGYVQLQRGWPWRWQSIGAREQFASPALDALSDSQQWCLPPGFILLGDFVVAIAIVLAVGVYCETRRRRRTRLLQFTLMEFLIFTTCSAAIVGIGVREYKQWNRQLTALGGLASPAPRVSAHDTILPAFARRLLNIATTQTTDSDFLQLGITQRVHGLKVVTSDWDYSYDERNLGILTDFPELEQLEVSGHALASSELYDILRMSRLRDLRLNCQFDAKTIEHCPNKAKIERLDINADLVFYGNIKPIGALKSLRCLRMVEIEDSSDLAELVLSLPRLRELDISRGEISNADLEAISLHENLAYLGLNRTRITNDGVRHLQNMPQLQAIDLSQTGIDDEVIDTLISMPKLRAVEVYSTNISDAGRQRLEAALRARR